MHPKLEHPTGRRFFTPVPRLIAKATTPSSPSPQENAQRRSYLHLREIYDLGDLISSLMREATVSLVRLLAVWEAWHAFW
jgi:hypothetical protein